MPNFDERDLIAEALRNWWGERCAEFEAGCPNCAAWEQYDYLKGVVHLKANSVESKPK